MERCHSKIENVVTFRTSAACSVQDIVLWHTLVQFSALQCSILQYSTVQYITIQRSSVYYDTVQSSILPYSAVYFNQCSAVYYNIVLCSILQYRASSTLHYPIFKSAVQFSILRYSAIYSNTVQCCVLRIYWMPSSTASHEWRVRFPWTLYCLLQFLLQ